LVLMRPSKWFNTRTGYALVPPFTVNLAVVAAESGLNIDVSIYM